MFLPSIAEQLHTPELYPPPLEGEPPGPRWLMQRLTWLVREEIETVFERQYAPPGLPELFAWWHECLALALSLARQDEKPGKKPTIEYLRDREFSAFWCLAELRFYLWSFHTRDHEPALRGALRALDHYPNRWESSFWRWSPALIAKADHFMSAARGLLGLAIMEERPLLTTVPEVFEMVLNAFGLLSSARVGEAADTRYLFDCYSVAECDRPLFLFLKRTSDRLQRKAQRGESPAPLPMPGPNGQRSLDWWVTGYHQKPRRRKKKKDGS